MDPDNEETYRRNASAYQKELAELDRWIEAQVAQVPPEQRKLVTDHETLNYFAQRYGFETVGAVIPGFSTLAEASAQELAALEDTIRSLGVKAIFLDSTVNPTLAERVAQDTGTRLVRVYSGSLSEAGGEAGTYVDYMRYNTNAIVSALR
jgi:ABC-type Zn uptake system ZnuABC Zn-binding protein ZnuA